MRDKIRWLAVPPALALLLMFGPWRNGTPRPLEPTAGERPQPNEETTRAPAIAKPDLTQLVCTVVGVCLLGTAVVIGLARARGRATGSGTAIVLRQSLRLSGKVTVHAVEFADKLLLLGERDGSLSVLHLGDDPELAPAAQRAAAPAAPDDDGAVLKDMILPRPPRPHEGAAAPARSVSGDRRARGLADFRTLLGKTQVHA